MSSGWKARVVLALHLSSRTTSVSAGRRTSEPGRRASAPDDVRQLRTTVVSPGRRSSAPDDGRQSRTTVVSSGRRSSVPDDVRQSRTTFVKFAANVLRRYKRLSAGGPAQAHMTQQLSKRPAASGRCWRRRKLPAADGTWLRSTRSRSAGLESRTTGFVCCQRFGPGERARAARRREPAVRRDADDLGSEAPEPTGLIGLTGLASF
jgi:hypothetical protein